MKCRLWIAVVTLILSLGVNMAVAAGFVACTDDRPIAAVGVASMVHDGAAMLLPGHPPRSQPATGRAHCSVPSPLSTALPAAGSDGAIVARQHMRIVPVDDTRGIALARPPLLGPPRTIA